MEVTSFWESLRAEHSNNSKMIRVGSMAEVLMMTKVKILQLHDKYKFLSTFHIHVLGQEDRVTSGPIECLAVYEELFCVGLRFPLHPFIINTLAFYWVAIAQLTPNSF